jgi:hypothetical protein
MTTFLLATLLLAQDKLDRADATAVAKAVLAAYKAKDLDALGALGGEANRKIMAELKEQGEKHPRYKSVLGGSRWAAVSKWDGKTGAPRYFGTKRASVPFGEAETPGKLTVVVLEWEDGTWVFEDVNFPSKENFEKGDAEAPKR